MEYSKGREIGNDVAYPNPSVKCLTMWNKLMAVHAESNGTVELRERQREGSPGETDPPE